MMDEVEEWREKKLKELRRQRRMCLFGRISIISFGIAVCAVTTYAWRNWNCHGLAAFLLIGFGLECCWVGFTSRTRS